MANLPSALPDDILNGKKLDVEFRSSVSYLLKYKKLISREFRTCKCKERGHLLILMGKLIQVPTEGFYELLIDRNTCT